MPFPPVNPLVREPVLDEAGGQRLDAYTGAPVERMGLRYWPEKGGEPVVKWMPTVANPLLIRALEDIDRLCRPARENAAWLERHPGDVNIGIADDDQVPFDTVVKLLGLSNATKVTQWFSQERRGGALGISKTVGVAGTRLRRAMASDRYDKPVLIRGNGHQQQLSESLFTMFLYDWSDNRPTNRFITMPVTWEQMNDFLSGRSNMASVFERRGHHDDAGRPFRIKSHDFRRLLNIVAQRGGLTQIEIAQWMGRRRVADNAAYDLRTPTEMASEMRALVSRNEVYGTIADQVRMLPESERGIFLNSRLAMIHTTPHGQCASNIAESPCATAVSCLGGCRQYLRRKGDQKSRESLERIERETLIALENARVAMVAGKYNAENWVLTQETVLKTTRAALAIDDDPNVDAGELRHVTPDGPLLGEAL